MGPCRPARRRARSCTRNGWGDRRTRRSARSPRAGLGLVGPVDRVAGLEGRDRAPPPLAEERAGARGIEAGVLESPDGRPIDQIDRPAEQHLPAGHQVRHTGMGAVHRAVDQARLFLPVLLLDHPEAGEGRSRGIHHHLSPAAVHHHQAARGDAPGRVLEAHHRRDPEGAGDDGRVVGGGAHVRHHREHALPVELRRLGGRQALGDQDEAAGQVLEGRGVRRASQVELDPAQHVVEVGAPLAQVGIRELGEEGVELVGDRPQRPLRVDPFVADHGAHPVEQERVVQHQQVGVEDVRVRHPYLAGEPVPDGLELDPRGLHRAHQARHLRFRSLGSQDQTEHRCGVALHDERPPERDSRRYPGTLQLHRLTLPPRTRSPRG